MRKFLGILFFAAALYFLLPLAGGIVHIGMIVPMFALFVLSVWCFFGKRFPLWLRRILIVLYALVLIAVGLFLWQMTAAAKSAPIAENGSSTVVVLGCEVIGERPSLMLQNRINAAYAYLTAHPDAACVCSGGMADDEIITEASCIADTLMEMGISSARIYTEEYSANTAENLRFSADLIRREHLSPIVVIATDNFHEYRAALHAVRNGLTPFSIGCRSPWYLSGGYWCREMAAILALYII